MGPLTVSAGLPWIRVNAAALVVFAMSPRDVRRVTGVVVRWSFRVLEDIDKLFRHAAVGASLAVWKG
jgi:hypothetical protein